MPTRPRAPKGLEATGRALWRDIAGTYELRPDELRILAAACREADIIERLDALLADAPSLTTTGYNGQPVAHPALTETRLHRATLAALLRQLHLPDTPGTATRRTSELARRAARARWGPGGTRG